MVVIVLLLAGVLVFVFMNGQNQGVSDQASEERTLREVPGSARLVVDQESTESVMEQMREQVAEGMFECQMSMNWTFNDGSAESKDAYVANSVNNQYPIFFDVILQDTGEVIYSSPVLPVGTEWKNFKLDTPLSAGEYEAQVMYTLIRDEESQEEISKAAFIVTLNVLN